MHAGPFLSKKDAEEYIETDLAVCVEDLNDFADSCKAKTTKGILRWGEKNGYISGYTFMGRNDWTEYELVEIPINFTREEAAEILRDIAKTIV